MSSKHLAQVSVFYRNDRPNGLGFTLTDAFGPLEDVIDTLEQHYELLYREAVKQSELEPFIKDLFDQLDRFSRPEQKRNLHLKDMLIVVGSVMLLQKYGFIKPDEFNGMQYAYVGTWQGQRHGRDGF